MEESDLLEQCKRAIAIGTRGKNEPEKMQAFLTAVYQAENKTIKLDEVIKKLYPDDWKKAQTLAEKMEERRQKKDRLRKFVTKINDRLSTTPYAFCLFLTSSKSKNTFAIATDPQTIFSQR